MIEDLTYRCDGCSARVVVKPEHQEAAVPGGESDRVIVRVPEGWDHRYGGKGLAFLHRCSDCVRRDVNFA